MSTVKTNSAGRFAPSPTGPLHLGSLVAALGSYLLARRNGLRWLVRIDDLDRPRVVEGAADGILRLLEELGFAWDEEPLWQSRRDSRYAEVFEGLKSRGLVYPCGCSRKEILASAPHVGEEGAVYPGTCREEVRGSRELPAWRLRVGQEPIRFNDGFYGEIVQNLTEEVGDFVLYRADGLFAYQLATVIDDADSGVSQVVRGADLLGSTARQIFLGQLLEVAQPTYSHLPLLLGEDDEKISKRHGGDAVVTLENGSAMLQLALRFLGQKLPAAMTGAPSAEILVWALQNFTEELVSLEHRRVSALAGHLETDSGLFTVADRKG